MVPGCLGDLLGMILLPSYMGITPWKFNIAPENKPSQKERIIFQPSFFRGYVKFRGCMMNHYGDYIAGLYGNPNFRPFRHDGMTVGGNVQRDRKQMLHLTHDDILYYMFTCNIYIYCYTLEVQPPFLKGWFPNHHYFSRGLSSSKRNHHF